MFLKQKTSSDELVFYELRALSLEPEFNIRNGTSRSRPQFAYLGQH